MEESSENVVTKAMLELKLLDSLTNSDYKQLKHLLSSEFNVNSYENKEEVQAIKDIKKLLLHFSVQVSSLEFIKEILSDKDLACNVNEQDDDGNTPLHLAAAQGRAEIVEYLMDLPNTDDTIRNNRHLQPTEVCKNLNIAQMMQLKRSKYIEKVSMEYKNAFKQHDLKKLDELFESKRNKELINVNGINPATGENILQENIVHGRVNVCKWLLAHGADPYAKNKNGQSVYEVLQNLKPNESLTADKLNKLKKIFEQNANEKNALDMTSTLQKSPTYRGYLKKFTNFAQGYKLRWFVLTADGKLSYYKDSGDTKNPCRGSLNLANCILHVNSSEKLKFDIVGGGAGTIKWNLKGTHPIETNKWIFSIQGAIRYQRDKKSGVIVSPTSINRASTIPVLSTSVAHSTEHDQHSHAKDPNNGKTSISNYKNPTSLSLTASDLKLNDNLTAQGKSYINKVIETRLDQPHEMQSLHGSVNSSESTAIPTSNIVVTDINLDDYAEGEAVSDNDEDAIGIKEDEIEGYTETQYGPYAQEVTTLQKSIQLELKSVAKILSENQPTPEAWDIVRKSLVSITESFTNLNDIFSKRETGLVNLLDKERSVNNIWIQSVKDMEKELDQKEGRLASIDKERKNLKRAVQRKFLKVSDSSPSGDNSPNEIESSTDPSALEHIAKFISATKDEGDDSEASEFFDAEESINDEPSDEDDIESRHIAHPQIHESDIGAIKPVSINAATKNEVSSPKENIVSLETNKIESQKENIMKNDKQQPDEVVTNNARVPVFNHAGTAISSTLTAVESHANTRHGEKLTQSKSKDFTEQFQSTAVTDIQKKMERKLLEEGSFKGYEDGLRSRLKLDEDNRPKISLWGVLKSMVGKDMTRMTLPVSFNEPTSLLQRVAEDLEYSQIPDLAASFDDSTLRMLYVAAFAASSFASTTLRVAKPFNPLLGETYEYSRPDKHYRFFTEQVSHHPPISATWTESPKWDFWGESYVDTKFTGRTFNVEHLGLWYLKLRPDNNSPEELYTWKKPKNTVIGILVGNPQVDNSGDVEIVNHTTGDRCVLHFKARGWRSAGAYELRGEVFDKKGNKSWVLGGHWNDNYHAKKIIGNKSSEINLSRSKTNSSMSSVEPASDGSTFLIWKVNKRPVAPFHLTPFAITLNAPQPHLVNWVAPTDTRLRPDQRAMEDGEYDLAADEKHRLEEKQRAARRQRDTSNTDYSPRWFKSEIHPVTKKPYWNFTGEYWKLRKEHRLKNCGDIF